MEREEEKFLYVFETALPKKKLTDPYEKNGGIYFLFQGDELVYLGQSTDIASRIITHKRRNLFQFDHYCYYYLSPTDDSTNDIEAELIILLKPKYNESLPCCNKYQTIKRAAKTFKVSPWLLKRIIKHGEIEAYLLNSEYYLNTYQLKITLERLKKGNQI